MTARKTWSALPNITASHFPTWLMKHNRRATIMVLSAPPDFFGYNDKLELQYRGRLDNCRPGASADQIANRSTDLVDAMQLIAKTGKGPPGPNRIGGLFDKVGLNPWAWALMLPHAR